MQFLSRYKADDFSSHITFRYTIFIRPVLLQDSEYLIDTYIHKRHSTQLDLFCLNLTFSGWGIFPILLLSNHQLEISA